MNPNNIPAQVEALEARIAPAVIVVTTLNDAATAGKLTLRGAIAVAESHAGPQTIVFAPGLHGFIDLKAGTGYGPLSISNTNLTIAGPGGGKIVVEPVFYAPGQIFTIDTSKVSISGLTITAGSTSSGDGGAIFSHGPLTINDCVISGSSAKAGGAIYDDTTSGAFVMTHSLLIGNKATSGNGGALSVAAPGGIYIIGSKITGNSSANGDGGAYLTIPSNGTGNIVVFDSVISGNTEANSGALGTSDGSSLPTKTIIATTVVYGNVSNGAGTSGTIFDTASSDSLIVSGSSFLNNSSISFGGGMYLQGSGAVTITGSRFIGNTSTGGSGIFIDGNATSVSIQGSLILNNISSGTGGGTLGEGGGILVASSGVNLTLVHTAIEGNHATTGGGGLFVNTNTGTTKIIGSAFSGNQTAGNAGGAYIEGSGNVSISGTAFASNFAGTVGGGLQLASSGAHNILSGNVIVQNSAQGDGGGLYIGSTGNFTITSGSFKDNFSGAGGAGIFINTTASGIINTPAVLITGNQGVDYFETGAGVDHASGSTGTVAMKTKYVTGNTGSGKVDNYSGQFTS